MRSLWEAQQLMWCLSVCLHISYRKFEQISAIFGIRSTPNVVG